MRAGDTALRVAGTITPAAAAGMQEYTVMIVIRDGQGAELARRVVGVGALGPGDSRGRGTASRPA